ncbi:DNA ligase D [Chelatococcus asaccharovorans]|uniref:DNA ligase D n=1 Tax=Chelatococcus asaccharovorans TaxID=28210 RepID=UPI00224C6A14|nr:DNA ligase D [Chelatococcus asaccharovorans]CAH1648141.1 ATP-dependent DNA ligase clustered with Ku protein, LigD [Chelatococcus asaccharovorans]CAH1687258.1 ATP-dependent DNA ligase clustered with Ku protein, LigD [Chelatococcus asaccharovorans]
MPAVEAALSKKRTRRRDSESTSRYPLPRFRPFQLCTLTDDIPVGADWLFEMKFDGYRAQIAISGSEVVVYTRNGHDWTRQFKVILPPLRSLTKGSALIDGEIVAIDSAGRTNFSLLKTGIAAGMPLKFYAFDLLELNGDDLASETLLERKERLADLLGDREPDDALQYSSHIAGHGQKVFETMCAGGHEGVIAKRLDGRYVGDRTSSWLKIKCTKRQEFVVGGYRPSDSGRGMASLILGTYENGRLIYRGRVGTGFTEAMRDNILAQLEKRRLVKPAFAAVPRDIARRARWVKPELVAEVTYSEITPDGSLRHPSFEGMREDKRADQVVMEVPKPIGSATAKLDSGLGKEIARGVGTTLTHPDKTMYPGTQVTKAILAAYYAAVAEKMLPHIEDRPLSLVRDTDGDLKETFFQKHKLPGMPKAIHDGHLEKMSGKESRILWVEDLAGLIAGVQMNVLEFHVWGSLRQQPDLPHRIIFDIDPDEGLGFGDVKQAALDIRDVLEALGLQSWPLLSGGKGIHVVVPIVPEADWEVVKSFCQDLAELLARTDPSRFVANMSKARRKGRMFLDYLRNGQGATAICPWSTRARSGAACAVPVSWDELPRFNSANAFDVFAAAERAQGPDAWAGYFDVEQTLTEHIRRAVR